MKQVGDYIILEEMSKGIMHSNFQGKNIRSSSDVYIKEFDSEGMPEGTKLRTHFMQEIDHFKEMRRKKAQTQTEITFLDQVELENSIYLIFENHSYLPLRKYIQKQKVLSLQDALSIFAQIYHCFNEIFSYNVTHTTTQIQIYLSVNVIKMLITCSFYSQLTICSKNFSIYPKIYSKQYITQVSPRDMTIDSLLITSDNQIIVDDFGIFKFVYLQKEMFLEYTVNESPETKDNQVQCYTKDKSNSWSIGVIMFRLLFSEDPTFKANHLTIPTSKRVLTPLMKDFLSQLLKMNPNERTSWKDIPKHSFISNYLQQIQKDFFSSIHPHMTILASKYNPTEDSNNISASQGPYPSLNNKSCAIGNKYPTIQKNNVPQQNLYESEFVLDNNFEKTLIENFQSVMKQSAAQNLAIQVTKTNNKFQSSFYQMEDNKKQIEYFEKVSNFPREQQNNYSELNPQTLTNNNTKQTYNQGNVPLIINNFIGECEDDYNLISSNFEEQEQQLIIIQETFIKQKRKKKYAMEQNIFKKKLHPNIINLSKPVNQNKGENNIEEDEDEDDEKQITSIINQVEKQIKTENLRQSNIYPQFKYQSKYPKIGDSTSSTKNDADIMNSVRKSKVFNKNVQFIEQELAKYKVLYQAVHGSNSMLNANQNCFSVVYYFIMKKYYLIREQIANLLEDHTPIDDSLEEWNDFCQSKEFQNLLDRIHQENKTHLLVTQQFLNITATIISKLDPDIRADLHKHLDIEETQNWNATVFIHVHFHIIQLNSMLKNQSGGGRLSLLKHIAQLKDVLLICEQGLFINCTDFFDQKQYNIIQTTTSEQQVMNYISKKSQELLMFIECYKSFGYKI